LFFGNASRQVDRSFEGRLFALLELACASRLAAKGDWHREAILAKAKPLLAAGCSSPPRTALLLSKVGNQLQ